MTNGFLNRKEGGIALALRLEAYKDREDTIILALPRGGVPVGAEVAARLHLPLDVAVVRKLGVPGREELAFGAIGGGGLTVLNRTLVASLKLADSEIKRVIAKEKRELERRERLYREGREALEISGKTVIVVDDGLATGATMSAAVSMLTEAGPGRIVVAVPAASLDGCARFKRDADSCVCVITPEPFCGVGMWYLDFGQTSDEEVRRLLDTAAVFRKSKQPA